MTQYSQASGGGSGSVGTFSSIADFEKRFPTDTAAMNSPMYKAGQRMGKYLQNLSNAGLSLADVERKAANNARRGRRAA